MPLGRAGWPLHRTVERIELGEQAGWNIAAIVERRVFRLGRGAHLEFGHLRARRIETRRAGALGGGNCEVVDVSRPREPWTAVLLACVASLFVVGVWRAFGRSRARGST